ncbi:DUF3422 family protein [Maricaulis sp.]|uniref:DUF3422 family protein n=1 Tax=Maricaulis sp. TaxID=1486257 RepID=UPI003299B1B3
MRDDTGGAAPFPFPRMELASEYRQLHTQAHRRYPDQIEPPFLTWHIVTSLTQHYDSDRNRNAPDNLDSAFAKFEADQQARIDEVNIFVKSITKNTSRVIELGSRAADSARAPFIKRDVISHEKANFNHAVVFRCEYHREFVTFCFFLPIQHPLLGLRGDHAEPPAVDEPPTNVGRPFSRRDPEVDKLVSEVFTNTLMQDAEAGDRLAFRNRSAIEWDKLYDEAWRIAFRNAPGEIANRIPGQILGNFRGIVLPRIWLTNAYGRREAEIHQFEWKGHQDRFVPTDIVGEPAITDHDTPSHHVDEHTRPNSPRRWNRVSAGRCLRDNEGLRHAMHWPGGLSENESSMDPLARRRTVANLVLNGRALYASALAPPLPVSEDASVVEDAAAFSNSISRFCVFYCEEHAGRAQDGISARLDRLILRLHNLANNRLMALRGMQHMWKVIQRLDWVDQKLSRLEAEARTSKPLPEREIKRVYGELTDATSSELLPGGLLLRASRSDLYASNFKRLLPSLHIHRIEGWEPYDMFVSRKLYAQFDNIRKLGERAEALRTRLDRVVELAQLEASIRLSNLNTAISRRMFWVSVFALAAAFISLIKN